MSQQQKLEQVLELLLNEESDQAAELLHQIIVEKARTIYESIVEEEDMDVEEGNEEIEESEDDVGGEPNKDFTDEISTDKDEIDTDEQNDGEASDEEDDEEDADDGDEEFDVGEGDVEERVEDLEAQLAELRAEFDALMGEEMQEPEHADLASDFGSEEEPAPEMDGEMGGEMPDFGGEEKVVGEVVATMFEKKRDGKLKKAPEVKDLKKDKKVDEETQFMKKVGDTGQKSANPGFAGTGKDTPRGAEQGKSVFSKAPSKPSYGGKADNILGSKSTGGEYGKWTGDSACDDTPSDNVDVPLKKTGGHADKAEGKFVGTGKGSHSGKTDTKSVLTKAPSKPGARHE